MALSRRIFACCVLTALFITLVGCGGSPFVGSWTLDKPATRESVKASAIGEMRKRASEGDERAQRMLDGMMETTLDQMMQEIDATLVIGADGVYTMHVEIGKQLEAVGDWREHEGRAVFEDSGDFGESVGSLEGDALHVSPKEWSSELLEHLVLIFKRGE